MEHDRIHERSARMVLDGLELGDRIEPGGLARLAHEVGHLDHDRAGLAALPWRDLRYAAIKQRFFLRIDAR